MAAATVAGATAAAAGGALFDYNRENYLYDAELRYERFISGREFAVQQMEQYRSDIKQLTTLTIKKNNMYCIVATLCAALGITLYGAGRLGLHGPSPPGWCLGLFFTNCASIFCFLFLCIFLSMHANFRAQAACTSLRTRKARVPVPTMKQLDQSRRLASEFEQQAWGDIFRVPYISNNGAPKTDAVIEGSRAHSVPPAQARRARAKASSWVRDEFETDRAGTVTGPHGMGGPLPENAPPEHFRLYAAAQKEWFQYEVYARVCLFYGFRELIHSAALYGLVHIIVELRAFWPAWCAAFVFEVAHFLIIKFDVVPHHNRQRKERLPYCEYFGHGTTLFMAIGLSLDFRVEFNMFAMGLTWAAAVIAYICEILYQFRMLEIILPDDIHTPLQPEDRIGSQWWPERWRVPSLFTHVLFFVAPPEQLQPGQHDIVREVKEGVGMEVWDGITGSLNDTCATGPKLLPSGVSRDEIVSQVQYVDRLFEWAFSNQVFESMTPGGKAKVRELYHGFAAARAAGPEAQSLPQVLQDSLAGLETIMSAEGLPPLNGSGYGSGSDYDSPVSGAGGLPTAIRKIPHNFFPVPGAQGMEPWRLVSIVQLAFACSWIFLILCVVVDIIFGDQAFLTAPHWSRPPMTRPAQLPSGLSTPLGGGFIGDTRPLTPEQMAWTEEHRAPGKQIVGPNLNADRRLSSWSEYTTAPSADQLRTALNALMQALPTPSQKAFTTTTKAPVTFPGFFEPKILACGPQGSVAAITPRGLGAVAKLAGGKDASVEFKLSGLTNLPPLIAASWSNDDLIVITRHGHLLTCQGSTTVRSCVPLGATHRLPLLEGARLTAATAKYLSLDHAAPRLHAAIVEEVPPDVASVYVLDGSVWLPLGDFAVPARKDGSPSRLSLSFVKDELQIASDGGEVTLHRLQDGVATTATHSLGSVAAEAEASWAAACGLEDGSVAHLRLHRAAGLHAWRPEIFTFQRSAEMRDLVV